MRRVIFCIFISLLVLAVNAASLNNLVLDDGGKIIFEMDVEQKTYNYRLETPDGTMKYENGHFEKDPSTGEDNLVVEGGYGYNGDDGMRYTVTYKADKNGYRPYTTFGTRIAGYGGGSVSSAAPGTKGIDPALLCSLAGGGCK